MELEAEVAKLKEENELLQKKQVDHYIIMSAPTPRSPCTAYIYLK